MSHVAARGCEPPLATSLPNLSPFYSTLINPRLLLASGRFPLFVSLLSLRAIH
jgi:hypothetical protein